MEKKYYSDESPFISGELNKWDLLVNSLDTNETSIEVVEELWNNSDSENRLKINELLHKPVNYFNSQQPIERSVSLSPFLTKNTYNSVCFKYKLTSEIIDELRTTWKEELEETSIISPFIVFYKKTPILWVNFYGIVVLLGKNELELWKKTGFEFTECDLKWNEISYGIN
jgi:hypothetical protein